MEGGGRARAAWEEWVAADGAQRPACGAHGRARGRACGRARGDAQGRFGGPRSRLRPAAGDPRPMADDPRPRPALAVAVADHPLVKDFICILEWAYSREQILTMEKRILDKHEWNLTVPTPYPFLVHFQKAAMCDKEMEHMVFFFAELALMHYSMITYWLCLHGTLLRRLPFGVKRSSITQVSQSQSCWIVHNI